MNNNQSITSEAIAVGSKLDEKTVLVAINFVN